MSVNTRAPVTCPVVVGVPGGDRTGGRDARVDGDGDGFGGGAYPVVGGDGEGVGGGGVGDGLAFAGRWGVGERPGGGVDGDRGAAGAGSRAAVGQRASGGVGEGRAAADLPGGGVGVPDGDWAGGRDAGSTVTVTVSVVVRTPLSAVMVRMVSVVVVSVTAWRCRSVGCR